MKRLVLAALLLLVFVEPSFARKLIVTVVNQSSHGIVDFYAANRDDPDWGGTYLPGNQTLLPNYELDVDIDDGSGYCVYDFLGVFDDGLQVRKTGINVCTLDVFYFTD